MLFESIFIIRGGFWGEEYDFKLLFAVVAVAICVFDWKWKKRKDYFWVFLTGFIFWSGVELLLQVVGIRDMPNRYLFGVEIPYWLSIPLQGLSEGTTVGVVGLFITDLYLDKSTRKHSVWFFVVIVILLNLIMFSHGIYVPNVGGEVPSRRDMFSILQLILIVLVAPAIYWLVKTDQQSRKRGIYLFIIMFLLGLLWYIAYFLSGQRWIEIGIKNPDGTYTNLQRVPMGLEVLLLIYGAAIEIALAYMPFLAIPYLLGLIKANKEEYKEIS
jgi:hypothetical protein